jgi:membrane protein implicated in regulation of membrane protease activity
MFITGTITLWAVTAALTFADVFGVNVSLGDSSVAAIIAAVASVMNAYLLRGARRSQRSIMESQHKVRNEVADVKSMQEQISTLTELSHARAEHIRELREITDHLNDTARQMRKERN